MFGFLESMFTTPAYAGKQTGRTAGQPKKKKTAVTAWPENRMPGSQMANSLNQVSRRDERGIRSYCDRERRGFERSPKDALNSQSEIAGCLKPNSFFRNIDPEISS